MHSFREAISNTFNYRSYNYFNSLNGLITELHPRTFSFSKITLSNINALFPVREVTQRVLKQIFQSWIINGGEGFLIVIPRFCCFIDTSGVQTVDELGHMANEHHSFCCFVTIYHLNSIRHMSLEPGQRN